MNSTATATPTWRQVLDALRRAWVPLVVCELVMTLASAVVLGPLAFTLAYQFIGPGSETALGNWELVGFILSPRGALAIVLAASLTVWLLFVEYSTLIVVGDAALRGVALSTRQVTAKLLGAIPQLFGLAVIQTSLAIVVALPFLGLAALVYWFLLTEADINYYLAERPPRFWIAVTCWVFLAAGLAGCGLSIFVRWALAVPACVLDGQAWLGALRSSSRLMRGRAWWLILVVGAFQLIKYVALVAVIVGLDRFNEVLLSTFEERLSMLVWSTIALLLFDTVVLQLVGAIFAVVLAVLLACEYENARRTERGPTVVAKAALPEPSVSHRPTWRGRAVIVVLAIAGPLASLAYALTLTRELVEHRPAQVTAHRAGSKAAPENSLAALRLSIEAGAQYVEIDLQQTADGHVVLLHDRDLRRVTGDPRNLNEVNLADLKDLRLNDVNGFGEEPIPTLAEFIAACDGRIRINCELKEFGDTPRLALAVLEVLREQRFTDRAIVSCFQLPPLLEIRRSDPQVPIGNILSAARGDVTRLPVDFLSVNQRLATVDLVRRAHQRGMQVHVWTVNDRERALRLLDLGCDNLITSDPVLIREVVDWYIDLGDAARMLLRLRRWIRE